MKTNALNTAFQLLKVIASGKLLQEQITEAEAELHIHFDQKQLLTANSALLDLLEKIKTETAYKMKNDTDLLNSYFRKITIAQKDYENVSLFLFLTEHPAEYLDYPDFASYVDFLLNLTEARRCQLFLTMIKRYNHMYLRDTDSDEQTDNVSSEKNISTLDVVEMCIRDSTYAMCFDASECLTKVVLCFPFFRNVKICFAKAIVNFDSVSYTHLETTTPIRIGMILNIPFPQILNTIMVASAINARSQFVEALFMAEPERLKPIQIMIGPVTTGGRKRITFFTPARRMIRASIR